MYIYIYNIHILSHIIAYEGIMAMMAVCVCVCLPASLSASESEISAASMFPATLHDYSMDRWDPVGSQRHSRLVAARFGNVGMMATLGSPQTFTICLGDSRSLDLP